MVIFGGFHEKVFQKYYFGGTPWYPPTLCAPCYCSYWLIGRHCNYCRRYDITIWPGETCNTSRWRWSLSLLTMWQNHCWRDVSTVWGHECAPSHEIYLVDLEHLNQICKELFCCIIYNRDVDRYSWQRSGKVPSHFIFWKDFTKLHLFGPFSRLCVVLQHWEYSLNEN